MNILGQEYVGIRILELDEVILPMGGERVEFALELFKPEDITFFIDNPMEKSLAIVMAPSTIKEGKIDVACLCSFSYIRMTASTIELNCIAINRVRVNSVKEIGGKFLTANYETIKCENNNPEKVHELRIDCIALLDKLEPEMAETASKLESDSNFADYILIGTATEDTDFNRLLSITSILTRMKEAHTNMVELVSPEESTKKGKLASSNTEVQALIDKFYATPEISSKGKEEIESALESLASMNRSHNEYPPTLRFVKFALAIPYKEVSVDNEIEHVEKVLKESHYGMDDAKERMVEFMAIRKLNPESRGMIILLDGAPGTGKTTLAQAFAKAIGRNCERISLGGCNDTSFIKGHGRTYTGSRHGRIMAAMHSAKTINPVIILDEVDKLTEGNKGDPDAALLELLDPAQNHMFTDDYLSFDYDLSKVIFIATSNNKEAISPAVYDRMECIDCAAYTLDEKKLIAKDYTIPKICKELGITTIIRPSLIEEIVEGYTFEPGVRNLEKCLNKLLRKVAIESAKGKKTKVTKKLIAERLGEPYTPEELISTSTPGVVNGMYYSTMGGGVLNIEAIVRNYKGEGSIMLTGQTGDVMDESVALVHSHMIANQGKYKVEGLDLGETDIHIHIPSGSTPKDGPSAGGAFALMFASLASDRPVKEGWALTGECTLTGRITPIGGVESKCTGAIKRGMTNIILPKGNKRDYNKLPEHIKKGAIYHFVEKVEDILRLALS